MSIDIKDDVLKIETAAVDIGGEKVEPEEKPVSRVIATTADTHMNLSGQHVGQMKSEVVFQTTAGSIARGMRRQCHMCKHFDVKAFQEWKRACDAPNAPMEKRREVNKIRAALIETQNADIVERSTDSEGYIDAEHAMSMMGICRPLSEIHSDAVVVYPIGTCPDEVVTESQPDGLFTAKDVESERAGANAFDQIMMRAAGKMP